MCDQTILLYVLFFRIYVMFSNSDNSQKIFHGFIYFTRVNFQWQRGKEQFKSNLILFLYENTNSSGRRKLLSKTLKDLKRWITG